ncbi:MAG TPA: hypothetical protein VND19_12780 [Acetobacteraceae bacterium]|nr:hypothetical protein [Acetobacteraceae bacterium]
MNRPLPLQTALPMGLAFELADLVLVQGWSEYHDLRMVVELDYSAAGDEYEEVVALYPRDSSFRRWMMWRGVSEVVVQPMIGRAQGFASVAVALEHLIPARA